MTVQAAAETLHRLLPKSFPPLPSPSCGVEKADPHTPKPGLPPPPRVPNIDRREVYLKYTWRFHPQPLSLEARKDQNYRPNLQFRPIYFKVFRRR